MASCCRQHRTIASRSTARDGEVFHGRWEILRDANLRPKTSASFLLHESRYRHHDLAWLLRIGKVPVDEAPNRQPMMTKASWTIGREAEFEQARLPMTFHWIHHLLVYDGHRLVGSLRVLPARFSYGPGPSFPPGEEQRVRTESHRLAA